MHRGGSSMRHLSTMDVLGACLRIFKRYWKQCVGVLLLFYTLTYLNNDSGIEQDKQLYLEPTPTYVNQVKLSSHSRTTADQNVSDEITVVTAYWNLGSFLKGGDNTYFDTALYHRWANTFQYLLNPLVIYTDSEDFVDLMSSKRNSSFHRTRLFIVDRNSSWAFRNVEKVRELYSTPGYPKHHPNTVIPEYACAQHAKYDVTARAAKENLFQTKYFAWLDVGYFRDRISKQSFLAWLDMGYVKDRNSKQYFHLVKPDGFNESLVAMNEVNRKQDHETAKEIFRSNKVWLGGGLFLGHRDVIIAYENQFRRAVDYFITIGEMNTDQQVLYGMYSSEGLQQLKPEIKTQNYWSSGDWFFLGKKMVEELDAPR